MKPQRIWIIRHAETDYNAQRRWQGRLNIPLNDVGREQAAQLAGYLKGKSISTIYSSPLERAWQTAMPISETLNCELIADERWSELNAGIFQGLTGTDAQTKYPSEWAAYRGENGFTYRIPEGESLHDLQQRGLAAWQDAVDQNRGEQIAIVSHGGTIRMLLMGLFGDAAMDDVALPNTSISIVEWWSEVDEWQLVSTGQIPHLIG